MKPDDEIELASEQEVEVFRIQWETHQGLKRTYAPEYTGHSKRELERIDDEYQKSREVSEAKLAAWAEGRDARMKARRESNSAESKAKMAALRAKKKSADEEKWNKAFEKHEDKGYYGLDPFSQKRG